MRIVERYPALGFSFYRRYWLASLASVGGWQIASLTMGWLVYDISGSTLDLGILGAATALPAIALTLVGGVIADRFDKRLVLICTTVLNSALLMLLAVLDVTGLISVWQIWLVAAAISVVSGIDWPARQSFFPHLIDRPALLSAVALNSVLWQVTRMVLPALGGILLAWYAPSLIFALAAVGYLVMLLVISRIDIKLPGEKSTSPVQQTLEGVRFILSHSLFRNLILLCYATMLFLGSYMQLMPAFAKMLQAGPAGFGVLMSATGAGSIVGTMLVGVVRANSAYGKIMLAAAAFAVAMLFGFALVTLIPSYALSLLFALAAAAGISVFLVLSNTALQVAVPDTLRGRVMGIHGITYSLMPLGALLIGSLADKVGTASALMLGLAAYLIVWAWIGVREKVVRELVGPAT